MSELNKIRLNKVIREFNISLERVVEFLYSKGHEIEARPTTKISQSQYDLLLAEFKSDRSSSCLLYTSPSPRDLSTSRMPSSA